MRRSARCLVALGLLLVGCGGPKLTTVPARAAPEHVASNILRPDYVGSKECRYCHPAIYDSWSGSPMHHMTRRVSSARLQAPFTGDTFRVQHDTVTMETRGGRRFMRLETVEDGAQLFRITKVIGGRYREDYVGIEVTDAADPVNDRGHGAEKVMPVSFVFSSQTWRYKGYSVMVPERPGMGAGPIWAAHCAGCHNTLPYFDMLFDDLHGPGAEGYQGTVSDDELPPGRTWTFRPTSESGVKAALADELEFLGAGRPDFSATSLVDALARAIAETRRRLQGVHLVEVGVGCESCHGGSAAHADKPKLLPTFELTSSLVSVHTPGERTPTRAAWINHTCARCHTVLFSGYPWTWEGGRRDAAEPGGSSISSGEARDFLLGGCSSQMACTDCHNPHAEDRAADLEAIASVAGNGHCTRCHSKFETPVALAAHSHHQPGGAGSSCVACHMPRKNMGLDYRLTRYHRIGAPTDTARVQGDRPLECALCHADKSVESLVTTMESWWKKRYDRAALRALYGDDLGVNVLVATLARGKAHEQAVAIGVWGERGDVSVLPRLAPMLAHEYPLVRYFARRALERLTGAPVPVDVNLPATQALAAAQEWLTSRASAPAAPAPSPPSPSPSPPAAPSPSPPAAPSP